MTTPNQLLKYHAEGVTLFSNSMELSSTLIQATKDIHKVENSETIQIYKRAHRKCVFLIRQPSEKITELVVKGYPLSKLKDKLKHQKFGWSEALNLIQAEALNIHIPHFHGYIEARKWGFITANGVLIQNLSAHKTLMEMLKDSPNDISKILDLAIPVISEFYTKGVNYIDMSPHNLMVKDLSDIPITIDWQSCRFIQPKNVRQLILQAAQFLRYLNETISTQQQDIWTSSLYKRCSPEISQDNFLKLVQHYTEAKRPPKCVRYNLNFPLSP